MCNVICVYMAILLGSRSRGNPVYGNSYTMSSNNIIPLPLIDIVHIGSITYPNIISCMSEVIGTFARTAVSRLFVINGNTGTSA